MRKIRKLPKSLYQFISFEKRTAIGEILNAMKKEIGFENMYLFIKNRNNKFKALFEPEKVSEINLSEFKLLSKKLSKIKFSISLIKNLDNFTLDYFNKNFKGVKNFILFPFLANKEEIIGFCIGINYPGLRISSPKKNLINRYYKLLDYLITHEYIILKNYLLEKEVMFFREATIAMSEETDLEKILRSLYNLIIKKMGYQKLAFLLIDEKEKMLFPFFTSPSRLKKLFKFPIGKGIPGFVAKTGESIIIPDVSKDPRYIPLNSEIKSELCVPIKTKEKILGVINVQSNKLNDFADIDLKIFTFLASYFATIFELYLTNKKLQYLSITDELTGIHNYRYFYVRMEQEIERAKRIKHPLTLVLIDVDFFKDFNDTFGHKEGDTALRQLAKIIKENVRKSDIVARYGGDEFAIIMPSTETKLAYKVVERIRNRIMEFVFKKESPNLSRLTISAGISTFPTHAKSLDELITKADTALFRPKREGRNQIRICE